MNNYGKIALALMIALTTFTITVSAGFDFTLGIFGNANMDDTIDENDVTYVEGVIKGVNKATNLSDANYDGKVDENDIDQIKLTIDGTEKKLTLIDADERAVTVKKPVERVVLFSSYPAEAIRILGVQDKIVGVSDTIKQDSIYFPEFSEMPDVGSSSNPDYEEILTLNSDLVVAFSKGNEHAAMLPNIAVVRLPLWVPEDFIEEIMKTGYLFGKKDEAKLYINDFHDKYIDYIISQTENLSLEERPKVYVESQRNKYSGYGAESGAQQMIDLCGGKNILADYDVGSSEVAPEVIMDRDPDIIIKYSQLSDSGYGYDDPSKMKALWEDVMNRPELANVTAIQKKQVYIIDNGLNYGLDYPVAMAYWAKWFHPDIFKDLNPQAIHQEFLTKFQRMDYDLGRHGVFVYPPLNES
jgi:iron complex transport system substrate-binding protein